MTDEGSSGHTQHLPRSPYYNPNRPKAGFCAHRGVLGKKLSWKPARPPPPPRLWKSPGVSTLESGVGHHLTFCNRPS